MNQPNISQAKDIVRALKLEYVGELPARVQEIEWQTLQFAEHGQNSALSELFRLVHNIKGSAGIYGLSGISMVCHYFEDVLHAHQSGIGHRNVQHWLYYVDILNEIVQDIDLTAEHDETDWQPNLQPYLQRLDQFRGSEQFSVLAVESSISLQQVLQGIYSQPPFRVTIADNGLHALEKLTVQKFQLFVTSKETAVLNGIAVIQALRLSNGFNSSIPIILLTADEHISKQSSAADFIIAKNNRLFVALNEANQILLKQVKG